MSDAVHRRTMHETPRQRAIRHCWPALCSRMTKTERRQHVEGLRSSAAHLRSKNDRLGAELLERTADDFEARYPWKSKRRARVVEWRG